MNIDIFSDTVCPWCFIGKRRLERALAERSDVTPSVRWRTFQLNPQMPEEGMDRQRYLALKFGGATRAQELYDTIRQVGESEGIEFRFDAIARTPNTVPSHRLLRLAESQGHDAALSEVLFRAYFLEGLDIGDVRILASIAEEAGLDAGAAAEFLRSDELTQDILAEDRFARRLGIAGVPCFIIDGKYALSGAQEPEAFYPIFDMAAQDQSMASTATT